MSSLPTLPTFSSQFIKHIQSFQPDKKGRKYLIVHNIDSEEEPDDCFSDDIYWGNDLKIEDFYFDDRDSSPEYTVEDENPELSFPQVYYYNEEGFAQTEKFLGLGQTSWAIKYPYRNGFPKMRNTPTSNRNIRGDFSNQKVQQKTIEFLKLCGSGITEVMFLDSHKNNGDFIAEILKFLPDLKEIRVNYKETWAKTSPSTNFQFLENLRNVKHIDINYGGTGCEEFAYETEHCIFEALSKNVNIEELSLSHFDLVSEGTIEDLLDSLQNLKILRFEGKVVTQEICKIIFQKLKKLEFLHVFNHGVVSDNVVIKR